MKKYFRHLGMSMCLTVFAFGSLCAQFTIDSTVLDSSTLISGLDIPWEIAWGPDDWIWVTERYGRVSRINPENGTQDVVLDISSNVYDQGESGLLGMAIPPDVTGALHVFLVYTYLSGFDINERLVVYEYDGDSLVNPIVLLDSIKGNTTHDGSRLLISPDNKLFMTTGDAQDQPLAQDVLSLNGKTLRFNLDGTIPSDNPFPGSPVWSWGHRNHQGLLLAPNGKLYSSEHGPTTDDELNIIQKGGNYGWPEVHGYCDDPTEMTFCADSNVLEPLTAWTPTIAPSDIVWYDHPSIPEWTGNILMSVLKDKVLIEVELDAAGETVVSHRAHFEDQFGRIRDICVAPDGSIYLATNGDSWTNSNPFTHRIIQLRNNAFVDTLTSIENVNEHLDIHIYPNPVEDQINLKFSSEWQSAGYTLSNSLGAEIEKGNLSTEKAMILERGQLPSGVYLIRVQSRNKSIVKKLIFR